MAALGLCEISNDFEKNVLFPSPRVTLFAKFKGSCFLFDMDTSSRLRILPKKTMFGRSLKDSGATTGKKTARKRMCQIREKNNAFIEKSFFNAKTSIIGRYVYLSASGIPGDIPYLHQ